MIIVTAIFDIPPVSMGKRKVVSRRLPPSLNARMHWQERSRWSQAFKETVYWLVKSEWRRPPLKFAEVVIENHTTQPMDRDNLFSSSKPLIDGLAMAGMLTNDDEQHVRVDVKNIKVSKKTEQRLLIKVSYYE